MAAIWLCVTRAAFRRSPSAGVSGPMTAIHMSSAPSTSKSWCFQFSSPLPRPWSVVIRKVVLPRYAGRACIVVQSSRMKPSTERADCSVRSYRPLCAHSSVSP